MTRADRQAGAVGMRLVIGLVVVVALLVGADQLARVIAERVAGSAIQNSQGLPDRPDVSIGGYPFLTQFAVAEYDHVEITARDVPVGPSGRALRIDSIVVDLRRVSTARDFSSVHADTASARATIGYAALSDALGAPISYAGNGRVRASVSVTVAGRTLRGSVTAGVGVSGSDQASFGEIDTGTGAPALGQLFAVPLSLAGLPFDIRLDRIVAAPAGLVITLSGTNLDYREP